MRQKAFSAFKAETETPSNHTCEATDAHMTAHAIFGFRFMWFNIAGKVKYCTVTCGIMCAI